MKLIILGLIILIVIINIYLLFTPNKLENYKNLMDNSKRLIKVESKEVAQQKCDSIENCMGIFKKKGTELYNLLKSGGKSFSIKDPTVDKLWILDDKNKEATKKWEASKKRNEERVQFLKNEQTEINAIMDKYEKNRNMERSKIIGYIEGDDEGVLNSLEQCNNNQFPENAGQVAFGTKCTGIFKEKDKFNFYFLTSNLDLEKNVELGGTFDEKNVENIYIHKNNYAGFAKENDVDKRARIKAEAEAKEKADIEAAELAEKVKKRNKKRNEFLDIIKKYDGLGYKNNMRTFSLENTVEELSKEVDRLEKQEKIDKEKKKKAEVDRLDFEKRDKKRKDEEKKRKEELERKEFECKQKDVIDKSYAGLKLCNHGWVNGPTLSEEEKDGWCTFNTKQSHDYMKWINKGGDKIPDNMDDKVKLIPMISEEKRLSWEEVDKYNDELKELIEKKCYKLNKYSGITDFPGFSDGLDKCFKGYGSCKQKSEMAFRLIRQNEVNEKRRKEEDLRKAKLAVERAKKEAEEAERRGEKEKAAQARFKAEKAERDAAALERKQLREELDRRRKEDEERRRKVEEAKKKENERREKKEKEEKERKEKMEREAKEVAANAKTEEERIKAQEKLNMVELNKLYESKYTELGRNRYPKVFKPDSSSILDSQGCITLDNKLECAKKCDETDNCNEVWLYNNQSDYKGKCCMYESSNLSEGWNSVNMKEHAGQYWQKKSYGKMLSDEKEKKLQGDLDAKRAKEAKEKARREAEEAARKAKKEAEEAARRASIEKTKAATEAAAKAKAEAERKAAEVEMQTRINAENDNKELLNLFKTKYNKLGTNKYPTSFIASKGSGLNYEGCISMGNQLGCAKKCLNTADCNEIFIYSDKSDSKGKCCLYKSSDDSSWENIYMREYSGDFYKKKLEPKTYYCSGMSSETSKKWWKRGGQNMSTYKSVNAEECLTQCKSAFPDRKAHHCRLESYPSSHKGGFHYQNEACQDLMTKIDDPARKHVDNGWGEKLYGCCQYNYPKELGGVGPYNGATEGNANGYMTEACKAGYNFESNPHSSLSYGVTAYEAGKKLRKELTGIGWTSNSRAQQECSSGYALYDRYKDGGYTTNWGCGRAYYGKQHKKNYTSNYGCGPVCAKKDFFKELK